LTKKDTRYHDVKLFEMHELFTKVLAKRDLSRAGDLFSVPDADIVNDITEVVSKQTINYRFVKTIELSL